MSEALKGQQSQQPGGNNGGVAPPAVAKQVLRKPVFVKVDQLKPGTNGHTLTVKVVRSNTVLQKGRAASAHLRQTRIAECLIGDETGAIVFTARNEQGLLFFSTFFFLCMTFFFLLHYDVYRLICLVVFSK